MPQSGHKLVPNNSFGEGNICFALRVSQSSGEGKEAMVGLGYFPNAGRDLETSSDQASDFNQEIG